MKTNQSTRLFVSAFCLLGFLACKEKTIVDANKSPGIILDNMDVSIDPKDDFYSYVNGNWVKSNTIPDDESRWGGFGVLRKSTRADVLEILNTSKELGKYEAGTDQRKALLIFESNSTLLHEIRQELSP